MTRRSSRWEATLALAALASAASCRATPADCKFDSTERCLWEAGVAAPEPTPSEGDPDSPGGPVNPGVIAEQAELDQTLTQMVSIIGAGLEWPFVDQRARRMCRGELVPATTTSSDAWSCATGKLRIHNQPLALEARDGVLSLSAVDMSDAESAELFEFAQRRFAGWCAGDSFMRFEAEPLQEFYRCSLPDGPYLVVARFPRELEARAWQVSIAILDAG